MPVNVPLTNNSANMSRMEILAWVNEKLSSNFGKIEELCSGAAYCQFMDMLFPGSVPLKRVKFDAKREDEFRINLRLFQNSFNKIKMDKNVPIERLMKGRFQDNFEFLQWFKKFFDSNFDDKEYDAATRRGNMKMGSAKNIGLRKSASTPVLAHKPKEGTSGQKQITSDLRKKKLVPLSTSTPLSIIERCISQNTIKIEPSSSSDTIQAPTECPINIKRSVSSGIIQELTEDVTKISEEIASVSGELNFLYNKLRQIEIICQEEEAKGELKGLLKAIMTSIYKKSKQ